MSRQTERLTGGGSHPSDVSLATVLNSERISCNVTRNFLLLLFLIFSPEYDDEYSHNSICKPLYLFSDFVSFYLGHVNR